MLALLLGLLFGIVGACATVPSGSDLVSVGGPLPDENAAIEAALELTDLDPPVTVIEVRQGVASELYRGPSGGFQSEEAAERHRARMSRPAWSVVVSGADSAREEWTIDRETGEVLGIVGGGEPSGGHDRRHRS